ncbi:PaaI family thioesterase [Paracoccus alkanivorans]|nr:PaaI family thioesterase [Paracoccus alkanivorans]
MLDLARSIFAKQPFTRYLGAELLELSDTGAIIQLRLREELRQQHGFAHGGVLSYLADNAITFAGGMALKSDALTSEFKINYLRPAQATLLRAEAGAVSVSGRQAVCQCSIYAIDDADKTLCALAQGTVVRISKG